MIGVVFKILECATAYPHYRVDPPLVVRRRTKTILIVIAIYSCYF